MTSLFIKNNFKYFFIINFFKKQLKNKTVTQLEITLNNQPIIKNFLNDEKIRFKSLIPFMPVVVFLKQKNVVYKKRRHPVKNIKKRINTFKVNFLLTNNFFFNVDNNTNKILFTYKLTSTWLLNNFLYYINYLFTAIKTNWYLLNFNYLTKKEHFLILHKQFYKKQLLQGLWCKPEKFKNLFLKLVYFKDSWDLISYINKWITYSHLKKHKKIFRSISKILTYLFLQLLKKNKLKGFTIFFKGKLGRKGSVRKTKFFKKQGEVSYSTKNLRLNYRTFQIFTHTGVIGAGISLFYQISLTFCFMYIAFYTFLLFLILTFFFVYETTKILSQISFSTYWQSLGLYNKGNFLFKSLVFQLAGFPPMYVFFVKLNYLVISLYSTTLLTCLLIGANFIAGMLFYIQLYQPQTTIHDKQMLRLLAHNSPIRPSLVKKRTLRRELNFNYLCWSFFFFSAGSYIFITDILFFTIVYLNWY